MSVSRPCAIKPAILQPAQNPTIGEERRDPVGRLERSMEIVAFDLSNSFGRYGVAAPAHGIVQELGARQPELAL